jgi:hypothetical protein
MIPDPNRATSEYRAGVRAAVDRWLRPRCVDRRRRRPPKKRRPKRPEAPLLNRPRTGDESE